MEDLIEEKKQKKRKELVACCSLKDRIGGSDCGVRPAEAASNANHSKFSVVRLEIDSVVAGAVPLLSQWFSRRSKESGTVSLFQDSKNGTKTLNEQLDSKRLASASQMKSIK